MGRRIIAIAVVAAALGLAAAGRPAAGASHPFATVNGEPVQVRAGDSGGQHGAGEAERLRELLIDNVVLRQEAQRQGLDRGPRFSEAQREWRRAQAERLLLIDALRRATPGSGDFAGYYPRWRADFNARDEKAKAALNRVIQEEVDAIRAGAKPRVEESALWEASQRASIPEQEARRIVVARTSSGEISLREVIGREPPSLAHQTQSSEEVMKMWGQIIQQIAGQEELRRAAEQRGLFDAPAVREEAAVAADGILKFLLLQKEFATQVPEARVREFVERNLERWTTESGLEAEIATVRGAERLPAQEYYLKWQEAPQAPPKMNLPVTVERLPLHKAWAKMQPGYRRVLFNQAWGSIVPPYRMGNSYLVGRIVVRMPRPDGAKTLEDAALRTLQQEFYQGYLAKLRAAAKIEMIR